MQGFAPVLTTSLTQACLLYPMHCVGGFGGQQNPEKCKASLFCLSKLTFDPSIHGYRTCKEKHWGMRQVDLPIHIHQTLAEVCFVPCPGEQQLQ